MAMARLEKVQRKFTRVSNRRFLPDQSSIHHTMSFVGYLVWNLSKSGTASSSPI